MARRRPPRPQPHGPARRQHQAPRRGHRGRRGPPFARRATRRAARRPARQPGPQPGPGSSAARVSASCRPATNSGSPDDDLDEASIYDFEPPDAHGAWRSRRVSTSSMADGSGTIPPPWPGSSRQWPPLAISWSRPAARRSARRTMRRPRWLWLGRGSRRSRSR